MLFDKKTHCGQKVTQKLLVWQTATKRLYCNKYFKRFSISREQIRC